MKLTAVNINGQRHLALYKNGMLALLDDYGIKTTRISSLSGEDFKKINGIDDFKDYDFSFESIIDRESTLMCIGLNYKSHVSEHEGGKVPETPVVFTKSNNTFAGSGATVETGSGLKVDYEGELCVMIGKKARNVPEREALDYVLGYFAGNDVSSRLMQYKTTQFYLGKSFDNFYPNGPYISIDEINDPQKLNIQTRVNGDLRQNSNTELMIFPVNTLISYISKYITLRPGDCISTGTPAGVIMGMPEEKQRWLGNGDRVDVSIDSLGTLSASFK
ncbi:MAG: fumarylacetoacetate hydrolase family protein [Ferroplasma sp.]|uniref:fumarylacetoacetate hydrolase family protein n=1 Tax=Ferroplasma sp. TaxID=2591003 RepID=UPI002815735F|nr:fumarylacetoacetate hydrolase family protein [Ferroplasma sp.]WMT51987.1 MAG: fumarylacetoacetate hydrolase family protein [Ferroplasma sp.]